MLTAKDLLFGHTKPLTPPVSFQARRGELVALLGRNGVGKTTLLRTLCGLQRPLGGELSWGDVPLSALSQHERARLLTAVLTARPQTGMLTVRDVVAMGRMPHTSFWRRLRKDDTERIDRAISLCQLNALQHRVLTTLSDGEQQRAMIAKAVATDTPVIFLDEPTAFLDYIAREEVFALLRDLAHESHKLVLLTTHERDAARQYADHVYHLSNEGLQLFEN